MTPNVVLPLLSSLLSFAFAGLVFAQWLRRRRAFQLVWSVGLLWYGISAGTEFLGSAIGWSEPIYRAWYLIGAFFVAAYLGMGTVYLLSKTRFGYFVSASLAFAGLITLAAGAKYDAPLTAGLGALVAIAAGVSVALAATFRRNLAAHVLFAFLAASSVAVAILVLTAPVSAPGYATDPQTGVPIGDAMPGYLRPLTIPFNVAGALSLVFGALFSAYVFMPKVKVLRGKVRVPVLAQLYGLVAVVVNFIASLPGTLVALFSGGLHSRVPATILIALGGFIPGVTSGLNRFGVTWSFFLGEFIGVLLIFIGFVVSTEVFGERVRLGMLDLKRSEPAPARQAS
ncbi:MAG: hypothetical protein AUH85_01005 [Chloroflexi bacterium 13_1_40CM_4_68_4]|nr:MAG: hypothetical protein AUH85_01005 [Chloroflexi bacterium 13_1_40CM_4_68_4]